MNAGDLRYARGLARLAEVDGPAGPQIVAALARDFPDFARYLVEYPFGDVYSRPGLGLRERELAVVAALSALGNADPQLRVHLEAALHVGCTPIELQEVLVQISVYAGFPAALNGLAALRDVLRHKGVDLPLRPPGP
jgi:4-carboxymuconolactone decarboxylase